MIIGKNPFVEYSIPSCCYLYIACNNDRERKYLHFNHFTRC